MGDFVKDCARGDVGEETVQKLYVDNKLPTSVVDPESPNRQYWDLNTIFNNKSILQEIKTDYMEEKTGNLAIEVSNTKGEPTGIAVTKAVFWVSVLLRRGKTSIWSTSTKKLKDYMNTHSPRIVVGGDHNSAVLHLYKSNIILPAIFSRIDGMNAETLHQYVEQELKNV